MKAVKMIILTIIGGLLYVLCELCFRGYSHWTMAIVGGICGYCVGELDEYIPWEMPFILQCMLGAVVITIVEFFSGCIINLGLGWNVWDYSELPGNVLGQICPQFFGLWVILCIIWIPLYDCIDYLLFNGEKPHYYLLGGKIA